MTETTISALLSALSTIIAALITGYFNQRALRKAPSEPPVAAPQEAPSISASGVDWLFVLLWVLGCSALEAVFLSIGDDWIGVSIAILQAVVLRRRVTWAWWWFVASALAWLSVWFFNWNLFPLRFQVFGVMYGASAGVLQWLVLRQRVKDSGWWLGVSIVSWSLGFILGSAAEMQLRSEVGMALGFAFAGLLTGISMDRLLRSKPHLA